MGGDGMNVGTSTWCALARGLRARRAWLAALVPAVLLAVVALSASVLAPATAAPRAGSAFDHFTTGFELIGRHRDAACEQCHVDGIFKGTPHECAACHAPGSRIGATVKPSNHIVSGNDCSQCHTPFGWKPVAKFDHMNVLGTCSSCHNGVQTVGKPANHIPTQAECSSCHLVTLPWKSAHFDHMGVTGGCADCHNNVRAPGPPATHIPVGTTACETCHSPTNFVTFAGTQMNHAGITAGCDQCHETGMTWYGVTMVDRPTKAEDPGHPATGDCAQCHQGTNPGDFGKVGLPAGHIPTTAPCSQCHTQLPDTSKYTMGATGHAGITSNCAQCHASGLSFLNMAPPTLKQPPPNHLPFGQIPCESCHSNANFTTFAGTQMNHAGITSGCQSCHETGMTWFGVTMVDRPTAAQDAAHPSAAQYPDCSTCHTGTNVGDFNKNAKPANHLPTTAPCQQCHTAMPDFSQYVMGAQGHAGIAGNCALCHASGLSFANMAPPTLKQPPANHLPVAGKACEACHAPSNFTTFAGTQMNHAGITSGCAQCHETGMTWFGVTMVDRPTAAQDPAHPTTGDCSQCHQGTNVGDFAKYAKPVNHIPTSAPCEQCHTAIPDFSQYVMGAQGHAGISTNCAACHASGLSFANMAPPTLKQPPANHIPLAGKACEACHAPSNFTTFANTAMNHAGITTNCAQCHETGMTWFGVTMVDRPTPAQDPNHPTTGDCSQCHQGTNVGDFTKVALPAGHIPTTAACAQCHTQLPDYSKYTMGATGHAGITSNCAQCHASGSSFLNMAPPTLKVPPSNHLPIPAGIACESCHSNSNFTTFAGTAMNHAGITANCQACHETGMTWFGVTMVDRPTVQQDPSHPTVAQGADCSTCHKGFNVGDFANVTTPPPGHLPTTAACSQCHTQLPDYSKYTMGATGHAGITKNCAQCHATGSSFLNMAPPTLKVPPSNHLPINGIACESCHSASNFTSFGGTAMNHAGITSGCQACHETGMTWFGVTMVDRPTTAQDPNHPSAAQYPDCSTCHTGTNVGDFAKNTKPANHIPTTAACAQCHTAMPNFAQYVMGATGHAGITNNCALCHAAGLSFANMAPPTLKEPPSNHIPFGTKACELCHAPTNFTSFANTAMNHQGITNNCQQCHEAGLTWAGPPTVVTRPTAAQDQFHPTAAQGADCSTCHTGFNVGDFNNVSTPPPGHFPITGTCGTCHTTANNYAVYTSNLTTLHTAVSKTCTTCHGDGKGPFIGVTGFKIIQMSTRGVHVPITNAGIAVECSGCHLSVTSFTGTVMKHAAIGDSLSSNSGQPCKNCHEFGYRSKFYGVTINWTRDSANHGGGATVDCLKSGCHLNGANNTPTQNMKSLPKPGAQARAATPGAADGTGASATAASATTWAPGTKPDHALLKGVTCQSCHNGLRAAGKPANHVTAGANCDSCHTTSAWKPAAFDHAGVMAGTCATCHNSVNAPGKGARHVVTTLSCDSCHYALGWAPTKPVPQVVPGGPPRPALPGFERLPRPAVRPRAGDPQTPTARQ
jgi:hypothetical protein